MNKINTLPHLLQYNAEIYSNDIALREKDLGIWKVKTWRQCYTEVQAISSALYKKNITKGCVVGLLGNNKPRWIMGELSAQSIGAYALGIYSDALDKEIEYLINYSKCKAIFVENEEQADKIISLGSSIPSVKLIIYDEIKGMKKYLDKRLISYKELLSEGNKILQKSPDFFNKFLLDLKGKDICVLCPTSGTTSHPKLTAIDHASLIDHGKKYLEVDPKNSSDEYVSVLPLPWIMEQMYSVSKWLICRMKINFVEEPETMMDDLREIGPTFLLLAPRVWEQIAADVRAKIMEASFIKRSVYNFTFNLLQKDLNSNWRKFIAEKLIFKWLRDRLGFSNLTSAATGGAALGPDTFQFFISMGIPLRQLYGQTELLGAYTIHKKNDIDFDSVGFPFKGVELKISNQDKEGVGEILVHSENTMTGYYKEKSNIKKDYWFKTGDAGYLNPKGHLVVIDRISDLSYTSSRTRYSPQYIENKLKFSSYIAEAAIIGSGKKYLSAIICIRYSVVSKWAEKNRIAFTTYSDLSALEEVSVLIKDEILRVNKSLPKNQRIKRFVLLYKEFDADDGELTRTRKLRRGVIAKRYLAIIKAIYNNEKQISIDTTISLQDGAVQRIKTKLNIFDL